MQGLLFGIHKTSEFVNYDPEQLLQLIAAFNELKKAVVRCAVGRSDKKVLDVRIILALVNEILAKNRI